jgi:hypothetical protein
VRLLSWRTDFKAPLSHNAGYLVHGNKVDTAVVVLASKVARGPWISAAKLASGIDLAIWRTLEVQRPVPQEITKP